MNLLSCYKVHSTCEPYFIAWSMNIALLQMSEWFIIFLFLSPRHYRSATCLVRTAVVIISSWPGQDVTRWHSELTASRLLWVTATAELKIPWRCPPPPRVCRCRLAPHASRFLRTTLASAVTLRTCDGLTLTTGGTSGINCDQGQIIFKWRSLNFKTKGRRTRQQNASAGILGF